jgi:ABC-2 type transport system permease protein
MSASLRRHLTTYGTVAAIGPKTFLAYPAWFWMGIFVQILSTVILVYFWRGVYTHNATLSGLTLGQTLNYILLAQALAPLVTNTVMSDVGYLIRNGDVGIALLRPLDFQFTYYVQTLAYALLSLVLAVPVLLVAIFGFGLRLPADPRLWACFAVALLLGQSVIFCFDWLISCLAFYTTEVWGLSVLREGVAVFFSGALVPLGMMPGWLRTIANGLPFAQGLYVPVAFLSGTFGVSDAPRAWLVQLVWLIGLIVVSRLVFRVAVRKVTIQGG